MKSLKNIGYNVHLALGGVAINSIVLWMVALIVKAGPMAYGLLVIDNTITVIQVHVMYRDMELKRQELVRIAAIAETIERAGPKGVA